VKTCIKCGIAKPLTDFYQQEGMKDGLRNDCKACMAVVRRRWYERNRDYAIRRAQAWKERNPERYEEQKRRYREEHKEERRDVARRGHLWRQYGLTPEEYDFLRLAQADLCAVCGLADAAGLHIDHHHDTGLIRGLLCGKCNRAIGLLREDPALFDAASSYLQRPQLPLGCGDKDRPPTRVRRRTEKPAAPEIDS